MPRPEQTVWAPFNSPRHPQRHAYDAFEALYCDHSFANPTGTPAMPLWATYTAYCREIGAPLTGYCEFLGLVLTSDRDIHRVGSELWIRHLTLNDGPADR
jgi:hypothetical protein